MFFKWSQHSRQSNRSALCKPHIFVHDFIAQLFLQHIDNLDTKQTCRTVWDHCDIIQHEMVKLCYCRSSIQGWPMSTRDKSGTLSSRRQPRQLSCWTCAFHLAYELYWKTRKSSEVGRWAYAGRVRRNTKSLWRAATGRTMTAEQP